MDPQQTFTGHKQHKQSGQRHFAEVTVRAEPGDGVSQVVLAPEVLETLHSIFATDSEHHRHCIQAAVATQIATINVREGMPYAGAACFRAEVVSIRVSGFADRELFGFLFSIAGMNAIAESLHAYEVEQEAKLGKADRPPLPVPDSTDEAEQARMADLEAQTAEICSQMTDEDVRVAFDKSAYVQLKVRVNQGWTEDEIRTESPHLFDDPSGDFPEAVREAREDALASRPMRS